MIFLLAFFCLCLVSAIIWLLSIRKKDLETISDYKFWNDKLDDNCGYLNQEKEKLMNDFEELDNSTGIEIVRLKSHISALERSVTRLEMRNSNLVMDLSNVLTAAKSNGNQLFTDKELKQIRFAIHPDKNGGKYNDLFIKLSEIIEGS